MTTLHLPPMRAMAPRGPAARILALAAATALALVLAGCGGKGGEAARQYHCPMHPTYVSDRPGDCPICGMRLVPVEKGPASRAPEPAAGTTEPAAGGHVHGEPAPVPPGTATEWVCPMEECDVHEDGPGKCPKCGMDLVERPREAPPPPEGAPGARRVLFYRSPMDPKVTSPTPAKDSMGMDFVPVYEERAAGIPAGLATVETTPEGRRLAGVQTVAASRGRLEQAIRAVGTVVADETRVRHVHTKIPGWVDRLYVDFTGQAVRKGMPVLDLYSQELLASQEEYLRAREAARRFEGSSLPEVRRGGSELVQAARRRLELFDVPAGFIASIERDGKPRRTVPLLAPVAGVVTAKQTFEGQQVDPGMELFTVTDLSRVWVEADVYAAEADRIRLGDEATVTLSGTGAAPLDGRVAFVSPTLDATTRTLKIRFDFPNPDGTLRPGMYADVRMVLRAAEGVLVPDTAVMDTGTRKVVFVAGPDGTFVPREVQVGLRAEGRAQVEAGLAEGERVAVAANFLLDSESRLRSALGGTP